MNVLHVSKQKGHGIVGYALLIAFIIGVVAVMFHGGLRDAVAGVFDSAAHRLAVMSGKGFDGTATIGKLSEIQKHYAGSNSSGGKSYQRGFIRSGWLNDDDSDLSQIAAITGDLGATSWVFYSGDKNLSSNYNGVDMNPNDIGLYWTTEDLSTLNITKNSQNEDYSKEYVMSYYYNPTDDTYSVIKNQVWMDQKDISGGRSLSAFSKEWKKGSGERVGDAVSTYREAQAIYHAEKARNNGSVVFASAN